MYLLRKRSAYLLSLLFLLAFTACQKNFLEKVPKGKLIAQKTADYALLLNNIDLVFTSAKSSVPMGDETVALDPFFSNGRLLTQRLFRWEDDVFQPSEISGEIKALMPQVYLYNKIISEVMASAEGTEAEKKAILAEARAGRAWCYFTLINYYGKPYQAATAATDPGYPIVTEADVTETAFTRATVKEVYAFIVADLTAALPDLPTVVASRARMSRQAAEAILAKVYVFMGGFDQALPLLNAAISGLANTTIPLQLYNYNVTMAPGGSMPLGFSGPTYPTTVNNQEILYAKEFNNEFSFTINDVFLAPWATDLFAASDWRLKFYVNTPLGGSPFGVPKVLRRRGPTVTQIGVILPELYLLRAEVKCRLQDQAGAIADLELLRNNRMPAADAKIPTTTPLLLLQLILEERVREFALQGYRWFDMRRLSVDPLFTSRRYTHSIYTSPTSVQTFELRPERLTMRFPKRIESQNPGFQNNP